jgi:hypothetical protein
MTTSLKDECFPSRERPLLGGKEKRSSEALPKLVLELGES